MNGLCLLTLCVIAAYPCYGQIRMMDKSSYRDHLKQLDETTQRWGKQIASIDLEKMKVSYATGRIFDRTRGIISKNVGFMHTFITRQLAAETLSNDITIEDTISDIVSSSDMLITLLPETQEGVYWTRTLAPLSNEMGELQLPLRKHISAFADKIELKAERCSR
jgi:hypothetical protein